MKQKARDEPWNSAFLCGEQCYAVRLMAYGCSLQEIGTAYSNIIYIDMIYVHTVYIHSVTLVD